MAIVDLLKILRPKVNYWEVVFWGLLLMASIIQHWMNLYQKLEAIVDSNLYFFMIIAQAMMYTQASNVITPDGKDSDTKYYFFRVRQTFFLILAGSIVLNIMLQFVVFNDHKTWLRISAIPLMLACAYIDRLWFRTIVGVYVVALSVKFIFFS